MEPVYTTVIGFARALFAAQGLRISVQGAENVPTTGGAVMVINHIGYMDFAYAGLAAIPSGRLVRFMAKESVFQHPVSGPLMRGMHHIPVDRDAGAASFRQAFQALRRGEIVGVFPEATISRSFEPKEFKSGAVRMAMAAKVPVIPTVIWGSQRVWTKGHPKRLGRTNVPISITVGTPRLLQRGADADQVTEQLREQMVGMLHEAQERYPAMPARERVLLPARLGGMAPTPEQAAELERREKR